MVGRTLFSVSVETCISMVGLPSMENLATDPEVLSLLFV